MKPLSNKKRYTYLITLSTLCIILIPFLVLYARGYRLNDAWNLIETGGIYVNPRVSGATIYIDDKSIEQTGLFQRSVLKQNLKKGNHKVAILKDGYRYWEKTVSVGDQLVTELHPFLLPKIVKEREVFEYVDTSGEATSTRTKIKNTEYKEVFTLATATTSIKTKVVSGQATTTEQRKNLIQRNKLELWIDEGNIVVMWKGDPEGVPYYFCVSQKCTSSEVVDLDSPIENFDFLPERDDVIIVSTKTAMYAVELDGRFGRSVEILRVFKNPDARFVVKDNGLFVKEGSLITELL